MNNNMDISKINSVTSTNAISSLKDKDGEKQNSSKHSHNKDNKKRKASSDKIDISPLGETLSLIEKLNKEKEEILIQINALQTYAISSGSDSDVVIQAFMNRLTEIEALIQDALSRGNMTEYNSENQGCTLYNKPVYSVNNDMQKRNNLSQFSVRMKQTQAILPPKANYDKHNIIAENIPHSANLSVSKNERVRTLENKLTALLRVFGDKMSQLSENNADEITPSTDNFTTTQMVENQISSQTMKSALDKYKEKQI